MELKKYLEITYKDTSVEIIELKNAAPFDRTYANWGITAIGCAIETIDGEFLMIHPKSVTKMRQYWK